MAQYKLSNEFIALKETSGVFFPLPDSSVEIVTGSTTPKADTGFVLYGGCAKTFNRTGTIYARALGSHATLNVTAGTLS